MGRQSEISHAATYTEVRPATTVLQEGGEQRLQTPPINCLMRCSFFLSSMKLAKRNTTTETGTGHFSSFLQIFLAHTQPRLCESVLYADIRTPVLSSLAFVLRLWSSFELLPVRTVGPAAAHLAKKNGDKLQTTLTLTSHLRSVK